jgi:hypothetical protein
MEDVTRVSGYKGGTALSSNERQATPPSHVCRQGSLLRVCRSLGRSVLRGSKASRTSPSLLSSFISLISTLRPSFRRVFQQIRRSSTYIYSKTALCTFVVSLSSLLSVASLHNVPSLKTSHTTLSSPSSSFSVSSKLEPVFRPSRTSSSGKSSP